MTSSETLHWSGDMTSSWWLLLSWFHTSLPFFSQVLYWAQWQLFPQSEPSQSESLKVGLKIMGQSSFLCHTQKLELPPRGCMPPFYICALRHTSLCFFYCIISLMWQTYLINWVRPVSIQSFKDGYCPDFGIEHKHHLIKAHLHGWYDLCGCFSSCLVL